MRNQNRSINPVRDIPKRLFSVEEAAVYLGRTMWALREMLWAGKLPYVKDGRRVLVDIHDMDIWIDENKKQFSI
jgi:excisionase family DNA binding protein